ncbi:WEB family protein, chloroplastic [Quillaja saponaria]|uniref:WEB family protein, chloroplastic n=1 Tax=Quillaja saponaria TaxID=32244 RepID=A0AAD7L1Q6_QUISA|nr:WEB family protein, chloroplastic [Quillaja saponaria]
MASKSRSNLSETPKKASLATPRVSKLSKGMTKSESESLSPLQNSRLSVDRSPRSVTSKPAFERRSPKLTTPPDKQLTRVARGSDVQAQLSLAQEDLKKAQEQLSIAEKDKAKAIDELKEAQRVTEEANEKLREALVARKRAEENSEIEKFRAVEMEQAGIEAAHKKEEEWEKELEVVRNQHTLDVAALHSTIQELQRVKQDLAMTCDAKNKALSHADDATKIAEIHAEKVEILSVELTRLKALLESKIEMEASENDKMVLMLREEIETLKKELELAKSHEEKLMEKETSIEQLNVELEASKMAESYAHSLVEEWKKTVEELEMKVEEAQNLERSASESFKSVMNQLERNNNLLDDAENELASLKEKVGLLEITIGRRTGELEDSACRLDLAKEEALKMSKKVEGLRSELEILKEEKAQALDNEKFAASGVQTLLEEKNKLINELENSRDEEEKSKKAMESLASALHEVSAEAREAKEVLLSRQAVHDDYQSQIADLKLVLKATNEKYKSMLDDAKHEIDLLTVTIEKSRGEHENSKVEWEQKELHLVSCVEQSEEQNSSLEKEIYRLSNLLKQSEKEASARKEEEAQLKDNLKEVESEVIYLQEAIGEAKTEGMKLKESLLDKENELQSIVQENEELRTREAASVKKVEELTKLLEEATARNQTLENGNLTDSEKDYDLLPKVVEFSEENGHGREDISKVEFSPHQGEGPPKENVQEESTSLNDNDQQIDSAKVDNVNGKLNEDESKEKDDSVEVDFKMWESCKIEKKEFSPEREPQHESFEAEVDPKVEDGEGFDQINIVSSTENIDDGGSSPKQQQLKKKKKPLLGKFGSLLKKKGASNQK